MVIKQKQIVVAVSGYFLALHKGHIELLEAAKRLGDKLVVIVNNNTQQRLKKGKVIHDCGNVKYIIERFKFVDEVIIATDTDGTVCQTLRQLKPDVFANGGDRVSDNVPERNVCTQLGIKMVYNIGGGKQDSSTRLLKEVGVNGL